MFTRYLPTFLPTNLPSREKERERDARACSRSLYGHLADSSRAILAEEILANLRAVLGAPRREETFSP